MLIIALTLIPLWFVVSTKFKLKDDKLGYYCLGYLMVAWLVNTYLLKPNNIHIDGYESIAGTVLFFIVFFGFPLVAVVYGIIERKKKALIKK